MSSTAASPRLPTPHLIPTPPSPGNPTLAIFPHISWSSRRSSIQFVLPGSDLQTSPCLALLGGWGGGVPPTLDSGFEVGSDACCFSAMNFHRTDVNRNISASVTAGLGCLACESLHSYKDSITAWVPLAVILSDHRSLQFSPPMTTSVTSLSGLSMGSCLKFSRLFWISLSNT